MQWLLHQSPDVTAEIEGISCLASRNQVVVCAYLITQESGLGKKDGTSRGRIKVVKQMSRSTTLSIKPNEIVEWGKLVLSAYHRIRPLVVETPVESIGELVPESSVRLLAKLENLQKTGSFKLRGATNKISLLTAPQRAESVIAASNGNHGLGVAFAAKEAGVAAQVYVSSQVSQYTPSRSEQTDPDTCKMG